MNKIKQIKVIKPSNISSNAEASNQLQLKNNLPKISNIDKINESPSIKDDFNRKNNILNPELNYKKFNYLSYVLMTSFSLCCSKYKDDLSKYSKFISFSRRLISFKNFLQSSYRISLEEDKSKE